jgi:glutamate dehydrogenase
MTPTRSASAVPPAPVPSPAPAAGHSVPEPADAAILIDQLTKSLRMTANEVVPWFLSQMPTVYFQDTDEATRMIHLRAIAACRASGRPIELMLRSEDGSQITMMRPLNYPGVLAELVRELPKDRPLLAAKIHTAKDGQLVLDTFEFGEQTGRFNSSDPEHAAKLEATLAYAAVHAPEWDPADIRRHIARCSAEYVTNVTPLRLCRHHELAQRMGGSDGVAIELDSETDPTLSRINVAAGNTSTRTMLERVAVTLSRYNINVQRAHLDVINADDRNTVSLLGFVVQSPERGPIDPDSELWKSVNRDLLRIKWIDQHALDLDHRHEDLTLTQAEVLTGLSRLVHQVLVKVNRYAFDRHRIDLLTERNLAQSVKIADLLLDRFNPGHSLDDAALEQRSAALRQEINRDVDLEDARTLLLKMIDAVKAVLRTNVYLPRRYALSMRIDPSFLATDERPELPFGAFFVHGRSFDGFHVRFRDIARGGLRVVRTTTTEQHARESERLYDEVYGLAFAQQLKNKDIPEGGAKATILLAPDALVPRSVKAFVDSILDLITPDAVTRRFVVDRFGHDELLYLGPDENITPEFIDWIVSRAHERGYGLPAAFMSSKAGAGINHKVFGVTSEGVAVFLDAALRNVGIDPRTRPFTIKITGGPDGDVAGNMINILHREYGENARIVGLADGSGTGEDHDGLNHGELLRLFRASLPIAEFDRAKLGARGRIVTINDPNGVGARNTMHNRVIADAFVPAGGRPNAIHGGNWKDYLTRDGKPSSPVVVEGANLFLTPDARRELSDCGTLIIKDSSANKCGVICSSYEICACMLLDEKQFLAIKDRYVAQVLVKLRELARREADLLMREHRNRPQIPLPDTSTRISRVILRAADAIFAAMDGFSDDDMKLMRQLVIEHLPPVLLEVAGDRLWSQMPVAYLKSLMAKSLAARIVYREGFEFLETMPVAAIARLAVDYLRVEQESMHLADEVRRSSLPGKDRIAELLSHGGILSRLKDQ